MWAFRLGECRGALGGVESGSAAAASRPSSSTRHAARSASLQLPQSGSSQTPGLGLARSPVDLAHSPLAERVALEVDLGRVVARLDEWSLLSRSHEGEAGPALSVTTLEVHHSVRSDRAPEVRPLPTTYRPAWGGYAR